MELIAQKFRNAFIVAEVLPQLLLGRERKDYSVAFGGIVTGLKFSVSIYCLSFIMQTIKALCRSL